MAYNAFPFDRHGNFVKAAANLSQCPDPFLLVSKYPFHAVPACTLPEGMKRDFSQIIGYRSAHGENSLATESVNAFISPHHPNAVEDLLTELSYTSLGEDDPVGVLSTEGHSQSPVGISTFHWDDYIDADFDEAVTLCSWSGEAALEYEKWIDRVVEAYDLEVTDDQHNTYPHFGGRAGFLSAEPIFNALTKYAVSNNFLLTNRFENIQVVSAVDRQPILNVKFSDGTFSIYGPSEWFDKYRNVPLSKHDSIASAAEDLSVQFDKLDASLTQAIERGRCRRALDYRVHVLANLPDMMKQVVDEETSPLQMGINVCQLQEAIKFAVECCSPDELARLPMRVRAQLPALYEDRSPTVREKIEAFIVSAATSGERLAAMFNKSPRHEQKSTSNDISAGPSI